MLSISTHSRKAQAVYLDFIAGFFIFVIVIVMYFRYLPNISQAEDRALEELAIEAKGISSSLITPGIPANWIASSVERLGIVEDDERLNVTKLANLANISYDSASLLFGSSHNFLIYFYDQEILNISGICGIGSPYATMGFSNGSCIAPSFAEEPKHLIKVERFLIHENRMVKMVVYAWE